MNLSSCLGKIDRIRDLTSNVRELTVRLLDPPELVFSPGQSLSFEIPAARGSKSATRYYSIASPPSQKGTMVLLLSASDIERRSNYLFTLKEGEKVQFGSPNGSFYLQDDRRRDILFVATGTGIAPFLSMLPTLFERSSTNAVSLFWGLRSERDIYYQPELDAFAQQYANFSFVIALSRSQKAWGGARGRVTRLVEEIPTVNNLAVYVCGNRKMVKDVTEIVRRKGDCPIYREKFYDELDMNPSTPHSSVL